MNELIAVLIWVHCAPIYLTTEALFLISRFIKKCNFVQLFKKFEKIKFPKKKLWTQINIHLIYKLYKCIIDTLTYTGSSILDPNPIDLRFKSLNRNIYVTHMLVDLCFYDLSKSHTQTACKCQISTNQTKTQLANKSNGAELLNERHKFGCKSFRVCVYVSNAMRKSTHAMYYLFVIEKTKSK